MHKLPAVEEAKTLFAEAKDWGIWRWLTEKRRVRAAADAAWEALDECEKKVKASWSDDLKKADRELAAAAAAAKGDGRAKRSYEKAKEEAKDVDPALKLAMKRLRAADEEAYKAHMDAEAQFDEADRRMSTSMACEGAGMAIDAWELREKFVRKMEALGRRE